MNIKDWKKFSDAIDKHNLYIQRDFYKKLIKMENTLGILFNKEWLIEKTEVNFWEWKAGKLKL